MLILIIIIVANILHKTKPVRYVPEMKRRA